MTRSDMGVIALIYATCLFFCYMTLKLKAAAQIYPLCLIAGLSILNTLYLIKCLYKAYQAKQADGAPFYNDLPDIFKGFMASQFFFILTACIAFIAMMNYLGFYLAALIYLVGVMLWLRVKALPLCITVLVIGILVYAVFTRFLKVPLPTGSLFG